MASPARRRLALRAWLLLSGMLFAARCFESAKPSLRSLMGDEPNPPGAAAVVTKQPTSLRIASWNLEWLNDEGRGIVERDAADLDKLAVYAERLSPDIVAVQEVSHETALTRVFPPERYRVYLAQHGGAQKTGFAYRKDLDVRVLSDVDALSEHGLRAGADLTVTVNGKTIRLLAVHLKAFCVKNDLDHPDRDCQRLAGQVPPLEDWIDARARAGEAFIVLGDFNRFLDDDDDLWRALDDGEPANLTLRRTGAPGGSLCEDRRKPRRFIDHIVLGGRATDWLVPDSFRELRYDPADLQARAKLSDHCPILLELSPPDR